MRHRFVEKMVIKATVVMGYVEDTPMLVLWSCAQFSSIHAVGYVMSFLARDVIYTFCAYATMSVSVCL